MIRVIIIDDDPDIVALYGRMLAGTDLDVVATASDGEAGTELARRHRPDLVLLDLSMPKADGLEVLTRLGTALPDTPIVVVSGFSGDVLGPIVRELGAAAFLQKGAPPSEVVATLQDVATRPVSAFRAPSAQRLIELARRVRQLI